MRVPMLHAACADTGTERRNNCSWRMKTVGVYRAGQPTTNVTQWRQSVTAEIAPSNNSDLLSVDQEDR